MVVLWPWCIVVVTVDVVEVEGDSGGEVAVMKTKA